MEIVSKDSVISVKIAIGVTMHLEEAQLQEVEKANLQSLQLYYTNCKQLLERCARR